MDYYHFSGWGYDCWFDYRVGQADPQAAGGEIAGAEGDPADGGRRVQE